MNILRIPNMTSMGDAHAALTKAGDLTLIVRDGIARWLVMRCPDNCGELLKVNLDSRVRTDLAHLRRRAAA